MKSRKFLIASLIAPVLYLLMYVPVWGDKTLTKIDLLGAILIAIQCVSLVFAAIRLYFNLVQKRECGALSPIFNIVAKCSIALTCFYGFAFAMYLFDIPIIPPQN